MMSAQEIAKTTRRLSSVAMGHQWADLVILGGRWVCVQSGEIIANTDIAISGDRIAYVGPDASHTIGTETRIIQAEGRYLVPGLLDGHLHIESGMLTVTEFVRAVASKGTTGLFVDPHEIANVFGLDGVRLMVEEALHQPIHVWVQMPSCVPSAPGLETPGGSIGPDEVREAMQWPAIIGLGEMMNFPGVINSDPEMHAEMAETAAVRKVIGGHFASPDLGLPFHGYVAGGAEDDHEGTRLIDAVARIRQGMKVMMRLGSAWHDVEAQVKAVTELGLDPRHFILCTDDSHSETLVHEGHMDRVVRHAIAQGLAPMTAIQMATINTAQHFGVSRDVGMIAPGRFADIMISTSLVDLRADAVIARGQELTRHGVWQLDLAEYAYPDWALNSVHLGHSLTAADFRLPAPVETGTVTANVIGVIENQAPTRHLRLEVLAQGGEVHPDLERDILKIALVERHKGTGEVQVGLVHGFGFDVPCAVGTTVAHDSHHMIVVGTAEDQMAMVANELAVMQGGQVVIRDGQVIGGVELPIAGLMSNERAEIVAEKAATILAGFEQCGCILNSPNMQLSLLALVVIPEIRLSDRGLVDVTRFEHIPVLEG